MQEFIPVCGDMIWEAINVQNLLQNKQTSQRNTQVTNLSHSQGKCWKDSLIVILKLAVPQKTWMERSVRDFWPTSVNRRKEAIESILKII